MQWTARLVGAIATIIVAAGIVPAQAVTLNTGGTATYNFDLSGLTPPAPPFALLVHTFFGLSDVDAGDVATFQWFDGLGGTGANVKTAVNDPLPDWVTTLSDGQSGIFSMVFHAGVLDGLFSVVITADQGSFGIVSALADGLNCSCLWILEPVGTLVSVTNPTVSVPEPGSLALLVGGLAAIAGLGRRRQGKRGSFSVDAVRLFFRDVNGALVNMSEPAGLALSGGLATVLALRRHHAM
jgi:hypothetical protein